MASTKDEGILDGLLVNSTERPPFEFTDYTQRVIVATLVLIVFVVGTIGNIMVILAVLLSKKLRMPIFVFVVNQSVADLLTCLVFPWDAVALLGKDGLPVGEWICSVDAIIKFSAIGCSICTLASIGLNRWLLITRPTTTYLKIYTPKKIAVWLVIIWLFPLFVPLIPPLIDVGAVGFNEQYHFCGSKSSHPLFNIYNLIRVMALFPVTLIIIISSIIVISIHLCKKKSVASQEEPGNIPITLLSKNISDVDQRQYASTTEDTSPSQMSSRQDQISKAILCVMCGFVICFTPYAIIIFINIGQIVPYSNVILYSNSCINPLIYAVTHSEFKTIFGCILRCKWRQIPQPSELP